MKRKVFEYYRSLPLSPDNKCSNYYSVTGKPFPKNEINS